ncbi:MAG: 4-hydroxy-tetrahydrodipicolinate synthase [Planctomycetota bacterium]|jgi:4-hydroxy-tetrahydrodipicolinate synthase
MTECRGTYTALVTPFTGDGSTVDLVRLRAQVARQAEGGVRGIVPCGTTGEAPTLSDEEHRLVVETCLEAARPHGLEVIAGAGSNCTSHAIHLHRFAHAAGADAALHVNPYYNRPSQAGLVRHYDAIADACDLPVVVYHIPGRTGGTMTLETIERLAAHPNIVAIKEASGSIDLASEIAARTGLRVLSGDDSLTLPLMAVGATGVISVVGNLVPHRVAALCAAALAGDLDEARAIHHELLPLARGLLTLDTNPVPVKTALALLGRDTGALRLPLCPPDEAATGTLRDLLRAVDAAELPA